MGNRASAGLVYGSIIEGDASTWDDVKETEYLDIKLIGEEFGPKGEGELVYIEDTAMEVGLLEKTRDLVVEELPNNSPEALRELESFVEERGGETPKWRLFYAYG